MSIYKCLLWCCKIVKNRSNFKKISLLNKLRNTCIKKHYKSLKNIVVKYLIWNGNEIVNKKSTNVSKKNF